MFFGLLFQSINDPTLPGWRIAINIMLIFLFSLGLFTLLFRFMFKKYIHSLNAEMVFKTNKSSRTFLDKMRSNSAFAEMFNEQFYNRLRRHALWYGKCKKKKHPYEYQNTEKILCDIGYRDYFEMEIEKNKTKNKQNSNNFYSKFEVTEISKDNSCGFHAFLIEFYDLMRINSDLKEKFLDKSIFSGVYSIKIIDFWHQKVISILNSRKEYYSCTAIEMFVIIFYLRMLISCLIYKNRETFVFDEGKKTYSYIFSFVLDIDQWFDHSCMNVLSEYFNIDIAFINISTLPNETYGNVFVGSENSQNRMTLLLSNNHWEIIKLKNTD
ncbi:hypothetical protein EHP00_1570 [Ecytonucleospora hepatopenaei]|uniref:Uncharacterized protein n=1 Tax=Ecytonucleospora hepatopenaei TaxID=646526 RepID=A0A1W0E6W6_9MICR|nr:hypothetical protein EHP00_1570 [Ecytonucleospora hepatopenaei]